MERLAETLFERRLADFGAKTATFSRVSIMVSLVLILTCNRAVSSEAKTGPEPKTFQFS
jgi:hypothetical protein